MSTDAFLHPFARPAAKRTDFINIVRGEGALIFDDTGKSYIDGMASLWYCNVGHGRAEIADAMHAQMLKIAAYNTFDRFTNDPVEQLAEEVAALAPAANSRVFFTSGGSEGVDTAMKLARIAQHQAGHPERTIILSRKPSYHGVNYGGLAATGLPLNQAGFGPMLGDVIQVPKDDLDGMGALCRTNAGRIAAIIAEPVIGAGGVYPPAPGYLAGLRALADEHGAYLIFDEVICGFGRLGSWFGSQHYGVTPDLTVFAKAITSGYAPLGGVIVSPSVHQPLAADPAFLLRHGYTYTGHPAVCAAGVANLAILHREQLVDRARAIGERLSAGLLALQSAGKIVDVRGEGAVWAVSLPEGMNPVAVRETMLVHGAIGRPIPPSTIAFCPPLVITDEQIDEMVAALDAGVSGA